MKRHLLIGPAVAAAILTAAGAVGAASGKVESTRFALFPNASVQACLAADPSVAPTVTAKVERGEQTDTVELRLRGFKPDLDFDLFTVERSPQRADGSADPEFKKNFGMAWYQSDIHIDDDGRGRVRVKTILLDQIFGFDAGVGLAPTNTFHLGFWFNDPADAAACGFTGFTPFNGEHRAGPLAFITRPDAATNLGPLCTDPTRGTGGSITCDP